MPAAVERRRQPYIDDFKRQVLGNHSLADGKNIAVVMRPGQTSRFEAPAKGATHTPHFVGDHGLAIPRSAEHDAAFALSARYGLGGGAYEQRIIHGVRAEGTEIHDFVALRGQHGPDLLFVFKSCVVGTDGNFHGHSIGVLKSDCQEGD
jgi:hypothetical protein